MGNSWRIKETIGNWRADVDGSVGIYTVLRTEERRGMALSLGSSGHGYDSIDLRLHEKISQNILCYNNFNVSSIVINWKVISLSEDHTYIDICPSQSLAIETYKCLNRPIEFMTRICSKGNCPTCQQG